MRSRSFLILGLVLLIGGAWWYLASRPAVSDDKKVTMEQASADSVTTNLSRTVVATEMRSQSTAPVQFGHSSSSNSPNDWLSYRFANTTRTSGQLLRDDRAILLENALIDTTAPVDFQIPEHLRRDGDAGAYVVQARGSLDSTFRAAVTAAGAQYVSYIPNNAWLVRASSSVAEQLRQHRSVQTVLPWEPIYKLKSELLPLALENKVLPAETKLNLLVFPEAEGVVETQLANLGATVLARERSPFGPVLTVVPGTDWSAIARLDGIHLMERAFARQPANDLSRVRMGVATNSITETNHLELTGRNVVVGLNDTGVDVRHPDFGSRIFALDPGALTDVNGHGTFIAGVIAGDGTQSITVTNARGSINPGTNGQYRGIAPAARLFVQLASVSDTELQENSALTNIFISNNSWTYVGDSSYSLAAASFDAAVRDSLPGKTGMQSLIYVFPTGNGGNADDSGLGGNPGSIYSPATAKNVFSVGAIEMARDITNEVEKVSGNVTNTTTPWQAATSSDNQVAGFSGRGNVGVRIEGDYGRVKPDVVAPGTFVISTRPIDGMWDEITYYDSTNYFTSFFEDEVIEANGFRSGYSIFLPENAVGFSIALLPNIFSPVPFQLPIYLRRDDFPTPTQFDLRRTNTISVPPELGGVGTAVGQEWFFAIANPTDSEVRFDFITQIITTNELGNYYQVLSNLNNSLIGTNGEGTHYYRYESGTSVAAGKVAGTLALMQEFFEQRLGMTNSPALMKALLINGARSLGVPYDFNPRRTINYQGWGLAKLANSLPSGISNAFNFDVAGSIKLVEQSPSNALATGQSKTYSVELSDAAQTLPLRITLTWTDPPGNPAAGVKLVNDLDLVVTNRDTGQVFVGNDIPVGSTFNFVWNTNSVESLDAVNNIENVYLEPRLGTNYDITVVARRVNVNAVTAHPNGVVQDFALVISSGDGEVTNAITSIEETPIIATSAAEVVRMTNSIVQSDFTSSFIENQRVGANSPLLGETNGIANQWKFYVVTNTTDFTNATFLISQQKNLAVPRMGVRSYELSEATRRFADLDLYVSREPALTSLSPTAVDAAFKSRSRNDISGDELIILADSVAEDIFYIGVKAEDQMSGEFELFVIFSLLPLGQEDANGFVRAYPINGYNIPDGTPDDPGGTRFVAIPSPSGSDTVRRVVVTNYVVHENYGDVVATLSHNLRAAVFDNHRDVEPPLFPEPPGPYGFLYEDNGEGDFENVTLPDGPGSFRDFIGEAPGGAWYFTYSDDALTQVGSVSNVMIRVERQCEDNCILTNNVGPDSWRYFSRNVPVEATNLTVCITNISPEPQQLLELYIRKGAVPTTNQYDFRTIINGSDCLTVDKFTLPPLQSGRYYIGVFNRSSVEQTFIYQSTVLLGATPTPTLFSGNTGSVPILDDAVTNYTQFITNVGTIAQLDVGLRIDHPRISDLAVTLISPRGTRVLLVENRGGTTATAFGSSLSITNVAPVASSGGAAAATNIVETGVTSGSVDIDYNFFCESDRMLVLYEGATIFDTGLVNNGCPSVNSIPRRERVFFGPGASTQLTIVMNPPGIGYGTNTQWEYKVSSINQIHDYLVFTDNTNFTTIPIKFAVPPFTNATAPLSVNCFLSNVVVMESSFEIPNLTNQPCAAGFGRTGYIEGWQINSGDIDLMRSGCGFLAPAADTGYQCIDINGNVAGQISTNISTVPGNDYRLSFAYSRNPTIPQFNARVNLSLTGSPIIPLSYNLPNNVNSLNWVRTSFVFTATSPFTVLQLTSLNNGNGGMFFDSFTLTTSNLVCYTNFGNYVLPEESLKALEGENAFGEWKLEILDSRTGAFNNVALLDWQLQFIFQDEVPLPPPLSPGVPQTNTICAGQIQYYVIDVPPWARFATNELLSATGPVNVYFNQFIRPTGLNIVPPDYDLLIGQTSGVAVLATNVPPLQPGYPVLIPGQRYYIGIENPSATDCVTVAFLVDFDLVTFPQVTELTNQIPLCTVNSGPAGAADYYYFNVSPNAVRAQFELFNLSGDMTLVLRRGLPPTLGIFDYISANVFTNDEVITVFDFSQPVPLTPGDWYFAAVNVSGPSVSYCAQASEWPVYGTNIVITNMVIGTNSLCLTWTSLPGMRYFVEGVTNLTSTNWATVSDAIVATDYATTYCVPFPSPFQFFRVREGGEIGTYVPPPIISSIRRTFRGVEITWGGPVTARYQVEWTDSLFPTNWQPFAVPPEVTSTTGLFQFIDDGSEAGPLDGLRYYRLVVVP